MPPGESIKFKHRYTVLSGREELKNVLPPELPIKTVPKAKVDQRDQVRFVEGKVGKGVRLRATGALAFPGLAEACDLGGTFVGWVNLDKDSNDYFNGVVMSVGSKQPDYQVLAFRDNLLRFYRQKGASPFTGSRQAWSKIETDPAPWRAGEWHHLALSWSVGEDSRAAVQIYLDGALQEARYNEKYLPLSGSPILGFGYATESFNTPRLAGVLDEMAMYNQPLLSDEIAVIYQRGLTGKPLESHPAMVLSLPCEDSVESELPVIQGDDAERQRRHEERLKQASR